MLKTSSLAKWGAAVLLMTSLSSCEDIFEQYFPKPNPTPPPTLPTFPPLGQDITFYALSGGTKLDAYSTTNPGTRISSVSITGLGSGETILAIDFRPATGQLYGVSSGSRLYVINQNTGAARALTTEAFRPGVAGNQVAAFDFNPTVDRIRLITSTGQNLRLNPETGTVANTDGSINGAAGATITGAAYTNNVSGVTTAALYDLDPATDQLYRQDPPNDGTLVAVGSLNLNISGDGGFDIDAKTGTALGLYSVSGNPTLFAVDLATGVARPLAQYAATTNYTGLAIPTRPVAYLAAEYTILGTGILTRFYIFDPTDPSNPTARVNRPLVGLQRNEEVAGLDFRPATGQLYALVLGSSSRFGSAEPSLPASTRLYTIDLGTGQLTRVADLSVPLRFGRPHAFDFNPVADQIRIVTDEGRNLQVNPANGVVTEDSPINPSGVMISSAAYTNSFAGATTTSLYALGSGKLYQIDPPNAGTLVERGNAPRNFLIDIGGTTNTAYTLASDASAFFNYNVNTINLSTGATTVARPLTLEPGTPFLSPRGLAVGLGF
ncbi:DUF4394 domain-containing protein [Hymenobacter sp. HD11105]